MEQRDGKHVTILVFVLSHSYNQMTAEELNLAQLLAANGIPWLESPNSIADLLQARAGSTAQIVAVFFKGKRVKLYSVPELEAHASAALASVAETNSFSTAKDYIRHRALEYAIRLK
jgi:hypothetical protein